MARIRMHICVYVVLLLLVVVAEGTPKAKKVKCKDKKFPDCYHKDLYCPDTCLRTCVVDCSSCQPVCIAPPPPPPPPPPSPPPPPKQKKRPPPPPPKTPHAPPPYPVSPPSIYTHSPPPPIPVSTPSSPPPPISTLSPPPPPVSTPSPPLSPPVTSPVKAYCKNKYYPHCYRMEQYCPSACPDQCEVDCVTCSPVCNCNKPGTVCQDPRFIGGDGITFYFHGKRDRDFCIVSDSNLHINAHFIGKRNVNMKRDFTWVQSLGIMFGNHQVYVAAKKTANWNAAIDRLALSFDGEPVFLPIGEGAQWMSTTAPGVSITRSHDANSVVIEVEGNFKIRATVVPITEKDSQIHNYGVTEEDCFAHLDLGFKFYALSDNVSGVLGQTYGSSYISKVKMGVAMPVLGGDKEFASSSLFTTDCAVSRFNGHMDSGLNLGHANMNCASGMDGRGVVCKR